MLMSMSVLPADIMQEVFYDLAPNTALEYRENDNLNVFRCYKRKQWIKSLTPSILYISENATGND